MLKFLLRLLLVVLLGGIFAAPRAFAHETLTPPTLAPAEAVRNATPNTYASDIKPSALWDGRKMLDFHSIDNPKMVAASKAKFLDDREYVLGITVNGQSRAYPTRFAAFHHVINDKIGTPKDGGEAFVTVTY